MRRSFVGRLILFPVLATLAAGVIACDSDTPTTPTPTTPTQTITETFSGSLTVNGAVTFSFSVGASGLVTATLRSITPNNTIQLGLHLGTWNGLTCQVVLSNDRAGIGSSVTGQVSGSGALCVRVSDVGQVTGTTGFEVSVVHP